MPSVNEEPTDIAPSGDTSAADVPDHVDDPPPTAESNDVASTEAPSADDRPADSAAPVEATSEANPGAVTGPTSAVNASPDAAEEQPADAESDPDAPADEPAASVLDDIYWTHIDKPRARGRLRIAAVVVCAAAAIAALIVWSNYRGSSGGSGQQVAASTTQPGTPTTSDNPSGGLATNWRLEFADDFDGSTLDESKWTPEHSTYGDGNNELQCHTPDNVTVDGGDLVITAKEERTTCPNGDRRKYSSGLITTKDKFATTYGRFEIRAKLPQGKGLWPAFWLLSNNRPYGNNGLSGELDVFEMIGSEPAQVTATAHWIYNGCGWSCSRNGADYHFPSGDSTDGFHTYALEWTPEHLQWEVDGNVYFAMGKGEKYKWSSAATRAADGVATYPAPFGDNNQMYLIVNLSVGGKLPGDPDESTHFPAQYVVDWVKVYAPSAG